MSQRQPNPARRGDPPRPTPDGADGLPQGTPLWITRPLVEHTLRVWQRFYADALTVADAVAILQGTARLIGQVREGRT